MVVEDLVELVTPMGNHKHPPAGMFQDNNATLFQDKFQDKSVGTPLPSSATMHPWKSVTLFQESNVRASLKKCARLQQKKDVLTPQDKSAGTLKVKHVEIIRERFLVKNAKL